MLSAKFKNLGDLHLEILSTELDFDTLHLNFSDWGANLIEIAASDSRRSKRLLRNT